MLDSQFLSDFFFATENLKIRAIEQFEINYQFYEQLKESYANETVSYEAKRKIFTKKNMDLKNFSSEIEKSANKKNSLREKKLQDSFEIQKLGTELKNLRKEQENLQNKVLNYKKSLDLQNKRIKNSEKLLKTKKCDLKKFIDKIQRTEADLIAKNANLATEIKKYAEKTEKRILSENIVCISAKDQNLGKNFQSFSNKIADLEETYLEKTKLVDRGQTHSRGNSKEGLNEARISSKGHYNSPAMPNNAREIFEIECSKSSNRIPKLIFSDILKNSSCKSASKIYNSRVIRTFDGEDETHANLSAIESGSYELDKSKAQSDFHHLYDQKCYGYINRAKTSSNEEKKLNKLFHSQAVIDSQH